MLSSKLSLGIWIGILRPRRMPYRWGCPKRWRTPLCIAICRKDFLRLWRFLKSKIIRSDNDAWGRRHRIRVEELVSPLPPDLRPLLRIPQKLLLEQWLDILDLHLWISAQTGGGFPQKKGQRGVLMEGVGIVVGSTTRLRNVRRGRRLRRLRRLEHKLRKQGPGQVPRNWEKNRSIEERWLFSW